MNRQVRASGPLVPWVLLWGALWALLACNPKTPGTRAEAPPQVQPQNQAKVPEPAAQEALSVPPTATVPERSVPPLLEPRIVAGKAKRADRLLQVGDGVKEGDRLLIAPDAGIFELAFAESTGPATLRATPGSDLRILLAQRRIEVRGGRVLIQADRMVGGIAVISPHLVIFPSGTTYLVQVHKQHTEVICLEGSLLLIPAKDPKTEAMVVPGERMVSPKDGLVPKEPTPIRYPEVLSNDPLLAGLAPLPTSLKIAELAEQQRRGILDRRNRRLRRELRWQRPRYKLPALPAPFEREGVWIEFVDPP